MVVVFKMRVKRDGERAQIRSTLWLHEKAILVGETGWRWC